MIAFASRTGNVRYIVKKLQLPSLEISDHLKMNEPFLLFTYTDGLGSIPKYVETFIDQNHSLCKGVIASGNSNFGNQFFCKAADMIHFRYTIPIVRKVELRGFQKDYDAIIDYYNSVIRKEVNV